jgi:hypothetical protein
MKQCMYCGWQFAKRARNCPACMQVAPKPRRLKRKIVAGLLALAIVPQMFSGGKAGAADQAIEDPTQPAVVLEQEQPALDEIAVEELVADEVVAEDVTEEIVAESVSNNVAWREFLQSYEEFVDDYVVIVKKMEKNPSDLGVLMDFVNFQAKAVDLAEQADHVEDELSGADLADYLAIMSRIQMKLLSAM